MKREDINIRDPFVLVHDGKYYLYGTRGATCWGEADGFDCYVGTDLEEFEGPFEVFHKTEDFAPHINYWAPEVYAYEGAFYMFASFFTDGVGRGTHCLKADNPLGPFVPHSDGSITPKNWASLDGTLYVEEDGTPYMVFCHEWEDTNGDGHICAVELTRDLKAPVGEPRYLFKATDAMPSVTSFHHPRKGDIYVTDGPFVFRDKEDRLRMIWSSFSEGGYSVVLASPDNGKMSGNWAPEPELLFAKDGGHGMLFTGLDGKRYLALHSPNETLLERPKFIEVDI